MGSSLSEMVTTARLARYLRQQAWFLEDYRVSACECGHFAHPVHLRKAKRDFIARRLLIQANQLRGGRLAAPSLYTKYERWTK